MRRDETEELRSKVVPALNISDQLVRRMEAVETMFDKASETKGTARSYEQIIKDARGSSKNVGNGWAMDACLVGVLAAQVEQLERELHALKEKLET